ncbi:MAG: carboxypeptidase M32 [Coxiella sp. (in: Bacteria)]|nr:MAG: carboxypeptidase M32 [Coxiella sp. (in: g-proteobacteria)]
MTPSSNYQQLESLFSDLTDLNHLQSLAHWDEAAMMPIGGGAARAQSLATLSAIKHQKLIQPSVDQLIQEAKQDTQLSAWQQRNLFLMERQYQNATCLPVELVKKIAEQSTLCEQAWRELRPKNDWKNFYPKLENLFQLVRQSAEIRADIFKMAPYDVLLDEFSPGVSQALIDPIFAKLSSVLPDLIKKIIAHQADNKPMPLQGPFDADAQRELALVAMKHIGFDFDRGRLDTSHHPFCGGFRNDSRITTHYHADDFLKAFFAVCHETGHACYEQHLPEQWMSQPVGLAYGMAIHESQSLIIEMPTCRSQEFMQFIHPHFQQLMGDQKALSLDNLTKLIRQVDNSFIRVFADEATYPLHVILRYEIERDLFNDNVNMKELPDLWHAKMQHYFNLSTDGNYTDGVMQDVHWPAGIFGYFPAYTLGRLIAQQFHHSALQAHPDIPGALAKGDFSPLMNWLKTNVHEKASRLTMDALLTEATGETLNPDYFIRHLKETYL